MVLITEFHIVEFMNKEIQNLLPKMSSIPAVFLNIPVEEQFISTKLSSIFTRCMKIGYHITKNKDYNKSSFEFSQVFGMILSVLGNKNLPVLKLEVFESMCKLLIALLKIKSANLQYGHVLITLAKCK